MTPLPGYDPVFLGTDIAFPALSLADQNDAFHVSDSPHLHYMHFSLASSMSRRLAYWVAWNIDGSSLNQEIGRTGKSFRLDKRVARKYQVSNKFYAKNILDRGHLARHEDVVWGEDEEAEQASSDSFLFTNIAPQAEDFNQSKQGGLWGQLENAALEVTLNQRMSCFAGPIFQTNDRAYGTEKDQIRIPSKFFKILVYKKADQLTTKAFVLSQNLDKLVPRGLEKFAVFEKTISDIESSSFLTFPEVLKKTPSSTVRGGLLPPDRPIESLTDIRW
jgi:endonuclease G, mitochondrial